MLNDDAGLDLLRGSYGAAMEEWIAAIRREEGVASVGYSVVDVDCLEWSPKEGDIREKSWLPESATKAPRAVIYLP
jgi:hypothetical protein